MNAYLNECLKTRIETVSENDGVTMHMEHDSEEHGKTVYTSEFRVFVPYEVIGLACDAQVGHVIKAPRGLEQSFKEAAYLSVAEEALAICGYLDMFNDSINERLKNALAAELASY